MSFRDYLLSTFPKARVTSGARDPNSPLGKANPRSWHNVGKAWDTAPIDGMTFDDYVNRVRQDGWNVLEARDEVKSPSRHATGPHWHIAVNGRKEPQMNLAALMQRAPIQTPEQQAMSEQPFAVGDPAATGLASLLQQPMIADQKRPVWKDVLGGVLDTVAIAGGRQGGYWPQILQQQETETQGRQKLAELMAQTRMKQQERAASFEDKTRLIDYQRANPAPTNAQREYEWMQSLSPEQRAAYQKWATEVYRPQFFEQGGQRYQVTQGAGMPQGYDPNEWDVVE